MFSPLAFAQSTNSGTAANSRNGDFSAQVQDMQNQLLSNPQAMEEIQALSQDPQFLAILSDPAVMAAINSQDVNSLQTNPKLKQLIANPKMRALIQRLQGARQ